MNAHSLDPNEVLTQWYKILSFVTNWLKDNMESRMNFTTYNLSAFRHIAYIFFFWVF